MQDLTDVLDDETPKEPTVLVPQIEENIPLPKKAAEAMPELTLEQELQMRAATIKLLSDLMGEELTPTEENKAQATELAAQMMTNPATKPDFAKYPNETMAFLAGMVAQSNCMLVNDLADFKMYVVNKLVTEIETAKDPKSRISALGKLGEIDGVDAFKKRTEVTVKQQSMEEIEDELKKTLAQIRGRVIDAEFKDVTPE
jgi:uncharacterized protein YnzC (UPF0291/DUF896 family)